MSFRFCSAGLVVLAMLQSSGIAQAPCDSCNGRCNYCVDHQCYPRRHTFGYWETQWRRWPVPPPMTGVPDMPIPGESAPGELDRDLPPAEEESSVDPDFSHRRKKASRPPAVEPPLDIDEPSPLKPDPFQDDNPGSSRKLGRNELRGNYQHATQASFGYSCNNPFRAAAAPTAVQAAYDMLPLQPTRSLPRHANPLRGKL